MKTNKYRRLVRDVIIEEVENRVNFIYNNLPFYKHKSVEEYFLDIEQVNNIIICNLEHDDGSPITSHERQKLIQFLKKDHCFRFDGDKLQIVKIPIDYKLKQKYNIAIDTIKDNITGIALVAGGIVVVSSMIVGGVYFSNQINEKYDKYKNSIIVDNEKNYKLNDIYVVYSTNNVHFCTRNMNKITENDKVYGHFRSGYGDINEYYYRDEIYDYYDINNGKKICSDHQNGFYIEKLSDFYDVNKMSEKNYKMNLDEIKNDINKEYLLSRDPGLRRK